MMDMKAINRVVFAALGFLCLAFAACTKVETDSYSDYAWTGEYPIKTQNGTTGEMEDHTGVIMLQFMNNGIECTIYTGISGMIGTNCRKFEARWSGRIVLPCIAHPATSLCWNTQEPSPAIK